MTLDPNQSIVCAIPPDERGVRTSRTRGGMRWTPHARLTRAQAAYGEVVWACRPDAGGKSVRNESFSGMTVTPKQVSPGRARISRKPSRRESRNASAALYARVRNLYSLRTRPRVQRAPGFPCALFQERGRNEMQSSGGLCRENAKLHLRTGSVAGLTACACGGDDTPRLFEP